MLHLGSQESLPGTFSPVVSDEEKSLITLYLGVSSRKMDDDEDLVQYCFTLSWVLVIDIIFKK